MADDEDGRPLGVAASVGLVAIGVSLKYDLNIYAVMFVPSAEIVPDHGAASASRKLDSPSSLRRPCRCIGVKPNGK